MRSAINFDLAAAEAWLEALELEAPGILETGLGIVRFAELCEGGGGDIGAADELSTGPVDDEDGVLENLALSCASRSSVTLLLCELGLFGAVVPPSPPPMEDLKEVR